MDLGRPLIAIAAVARNRGIGLANRLPWRIPEDFAFFKATTMGHVLLMGRKTYESIGRPLPGRTTVVLSRSGFTAPGVTVAKDWQEAAAVAPDRKLFLAGGAALYAEALPWCSELILTHVQLEPEADAFFPDWRGVFDEGAVLETHPTCTMRRHLRLRRG
ncbi:MAG: dihydrofolate reductase [Verrucomicrobiota bacterium]